jgi:hypothetical protein
VDVSPEIDAERNVVDIHEHRVRAVMRDKVIENAPGNSSGIGPAVRDGDLRHRLR